MEDESLKSFRSGSRNTLEENQEILSSNHSFVSFTLERDYETPRRENLNQFSINFYGGKPVQQKSDSKNAVLMNSYINNNDNIDIYNNDHNPMSFNQKKSNMLYNDRSDMKSTEKNFRIARGNLQPLDDNNSHQNSVVKLKRSGHTGSGRQGLDSKLLSDSKKGNLKNISSQLPMNHQPQATGKNIVVKLNGGETRLASAMGKQTMLMASSYNDSSTKLINNEKSQKQFFSTTNYSTNKIISNQQVGQQQPQQKNIMYKKVPQMNMKMKFNTGNNLASDIQKNAMFNTNPKVFNTNNNGSIYYSTNDNKGIGLEQTNGSSPNIYNKHQQKMSSSEMNSNNQVNEDRNPNEERQTDRTGYNHKLGLSNENLLNSSSSVFNNLGEYSESDYNCYNNGSKLKIRSYMNFGGNVANNTISNDLSPKSIITPTDINKVKHKTNVSNKLFTAISTSDPNRFIDKHDQSENHKKILTNYFKNLNFDKGGSFTNLKTIINSNTSQSSAISRMGRKSSPVAQKDNNPGRKNNFYTNLGIQPVIDTQQSYFMNGNSPNSRGLSMSKDKKKYDLNNNIKVDENSKNKRIPQQNTQQKPQEIQQNNAKGKTEPKSCMNSNFKGLITNRVASSHNKNRTENGFVQNINSTNKFDNNFVKEIDQNTIQSQPNKLIQKDLVHKANPNIAYDFGRVKFFSYNK